MPAVFNSPGVPPLTSYLTGTIILLASDLISFLTSSFGPQWGLFQNGVSVIEADSVISLEYKQTWTISDYPVEQGSFESYDKVQMPFTARLRFATGGSPTDRQDFLDSIAAIAGTLQLFDVYTPEETYRSVCIESYDYSRAAQRGVGLIVVDITCVEIRVNASSNFSNTKQPSGSAQVGTGNTQAVPFNPTGSNPNWG